MFLRITKKKQRQDMTSGGGGGGYSVAIVVRKSALSIRNALHTLEVAATKAKSVVCYAPDGVPNAKIRSQLDRARVCITHEEVYQHTQGDYLVWLPASCSLTPEAFKRLLTQARSNTTYERFAVAPMLTVDNRHAFNPFNGFLMVMVLWTWLCSFVTFFQWFRPHQESTQARIEVISRKRSIRTGPPSFWWFNHRLNERYLRSGQSVITFHGRGGWDCVARALQAHRPMYNMLVEFALLMGYAFMFGYTWTNAAFWLSGQPGATLVTSWTIATWALQAVLLLFLMPKYLVLDWWPVYIALLPIYVTLYPWAYLAATYFTQFATFDPIAVVLRPKQRDDDPVKTE